MVKSVQISKEIKVSVANKIGVLADISKIIAEHGINIEAIAGYRNNGEAQIMLVTDDNLKAKDALVKARYNNAKESPVIMLELENKTGAMKNIAAKLAAENIDINYIYGTTCPGSCPARLVLSTSNDEKALVAFKR